MVQIVQSSRSLDEQKYLQAQKSLSAHLQRKDLGYLHLPHRVQLWLDCQKLADSWRSKFEKIYVLGIGGSSLGIKTLVEIFNLKQISVIDNVDPIVFNQVLSTVEDFNKVGWVVISKSGKTIETLTALEFVHQIYKEKNIRLENRCLVITENDSNPLSMWAENFGVPKLEVPKDVGGRYSVLSPVGMFPAAFAGLNIEQIRLGAIEALKNTTLVGHLMSHFISSFEAQEWITEFWFYSSRTTYLGQWWMQLWAESLAKKKNKFNQEAPRVSTPISAIGASDQHSILQQVMEGARDKFVVFWRFKDTKDFGPSLTQNYFSETQVLLNKKMGELLWAEQEATCEAMTSHRVSTLTLNAENLQEKSLGFIFMLLQITTGGLGELLEINAFDQPGVELGKRLAIDKLKNA